MIRRNAGLLACLFVAALTLEAQVEGTITNASTQAPIPNVAVQLQRDKEIYKTTTGTQGAFRLENVPEGDYTPAFTKPGFRQRTPKPLHLTPTTHLNATLIPLAKLSG